MPGKLISGVVGVFSATLLFWLGIAFEHRPAGWPNIPLHVGIFHMTFHLPDGPYVKLAALEAAEKTAQAHARVIEAHHAQISQAAAQHDATAQAAIQIRYRTITREVHDVVTPAIDRSYPVPWAFVRLYNAGATGLDVSDFPLAPGQSDDGPSAYVASDLATATVENDRRCQANSTQLADLQGWLRDQQAAAR